MRVAGTIPEALDDKASVIDEFTLTGTFSSFRKGIARRRRLFPSSGTGRDSIERESPIQLKGVINGFFFLGVLRRGDILWSSD